MKSLATKLAAVILVMTTISFVSCSHDESIFNDFSNERFDEFLSYHTKEMVIQISTTFTEEEISFFIEKIEKLSQSNSRDPQASTYIIQCNDRDSNGVHYSVYSTDGITWFSYKEGVQAPTLVEDNSMGGLIVECQRLSISS